MTRWKNLEMNNTCNESFQVTQKHDFYMVVVATLFANIDERSNIV